ncbi:MAG: uroporphyrinogen decarboxylase [Magnetococcales bacterium]|nr:uroporphyrinogen decarboxylase [Magnetococcales bacterium]
MEPEHLFLRACLRLPVTRTPMWIMRQAGRYLPEYQAVRAKAGDFLALCHQPDLATQVTLQPVERFPLDAAILFSDILVVPAAMGMELHFSSGEGPRLNPVVRRQADIDRLGTPDPETDLGYVMAAIRSIRTALAGRIPLIGFSGSPWTLATYMVEGGSSKDFRQIKGLLFESPRTLHTLLDKLADAVTLYLNAQIANGVEAIQIFDTWGGVLGPEEFGEFSLRSMRRIIAGLQRTGPRGNRVPVILFAKGCGSQLEEMAASGADVLGLDWTSDIAKARLRVGDRVALQGNMDPSVLYASPDRIRQQVRHILNGFGPHPGHIFNLGHGIAQDVDPQRVAVLVEAVREESTRLFREGAA